MSDLAKLSMDQLQQQLGCSLGGLAPEEAQRRLSEFGPNELAEEEVSPLFMTLSILVFDFYPVTAVMIVLLALLNDGAILSIATDEVRYANIPERWNMRLVLGIASVLGLAGVVASFGLFYLAERVFALDRDMIQSLIYLKLSVAGHMTIFATRTRGPFWSIRPAKLLLAAVVGTQIIATLIAVYGIFMSPIGWELAGLVWVYALAWFLVNDRLKLIAYRIFDYQPSGLAQLRGSSRAARASTPRTQTKQPVSQTSESKRMSWTPAVNPQRPRAASPRPYPIKRRNESHEIRIHQD